MRIGINALFHASGGSLTNLMQLLVRWRSSECHQFTVYASPQTAERIREVLTDKINVVELPLSGHGLFGRLISEQVLLPRLVSRNNQDVLFCPANTMPWFVSVPCVVTFQNAAPFCPRLGIQTVGLLVYFQFFILGLFMRVSAVRATLLIFISEHFRNLFVERFGFPVDRGEIIYRACTQATAVKSDKNDSEWEDVSSRLKLKAPFILSVAHLHPFRNVKQLVHAFGKARGAGSLLKHQLVLVGGGYVEWYLAEIKLLVVEYNLEDFVILAGPVKHSDVHLLLSHCEMLAFTSTCENCPTTLVEALAHGVPIISSNVGVMPEVGGDAVMYFDPWCPDQIASAMIKMAGDHELRNNYAARAKIRAQSFPSEAEVAYQTLSVLVKAATIRNEVSR